MTSSFGIDGAFEESGEHSQPVHKVTGGVCVVVEGLVSGKQAPGSALCPGSVAASLHWPQFAALPLDGSFPQNRNS